MDNAPAQLPASWLDAGYGIPSCCVRHGNPAAIARKVQFISRPAGVVVPAGHRRRPAVPHRRDAGAQDREAPGLAVLRAV